MSDTAEGTVSQVKAWRHGKGYFLNLEELEYDFFGYGECRASEGDKVILEIAEGTGDFSDKYQITKLRVDPKAAAHLPGPPGKGEGWKTHQSQAKGLSAQERDSINRAVALRHAAVLVAALYGPAGAKELGEAKELTVSVAERFLNWLEGGKA